MRPRRDDAERPTRAPWGGRARDDVRGGQGSWRDGRRDGDRPSAPAGRGAAGRGRPGGDGPRTYSRSETGPARPARENRPSDPPVPDDVEFRQLDREVRGRLRTLSKEAAERVGKHLVMVARLIDDDPDLAYLHAQAAVRRAGRVDVAHEAAGLAAYRSGRYAEALRELRTVRRLNGSPEHLPVIADAERGLGRPERAIAVGNDPEVERLSADGQVELAMVLSGARLDLGQPEAAVAVLDSPLVRRAKGVLAARVAQARVTALTAVGRAQDADRELAGFTQEQLDAAAGDVAEDDDVLVFDLLDEGEDDEAGDDAVADVDEAGVGAGGVGVDATSADAGDVDAGDVDAGDLDAGEVDPSSVDTTGDTTGEADDDAERDVPTGESVADGPDGTDGLDAADSPIDSTTDPVTTDTPEDHAR